MTVLGPKYEPVVGAIFFEPIVHGRHLACSIGVIAKNEADAMHRFWKRWPEILARALEQWRRGEIENGEARVAIAI